MNLKKKFGYRIKELRIANNLTQEQLSEKLDMERSNLAKIEAGNHFPNAENIEKLSNIFNISLSELFTFSHFKEKNELISEIVTELEKFDLSKVQYMYKSVLNIKSVKK